MPLHAVAGAESLTELALWARSDTVEALRSWRRALPLQCSLAHGANPSIIHVYCGSLVAAALSEVSCWALTAASVTPWLSGRAASRRHRCWRSWADPRPHPSPPLPPQSPPPLLHLSWPLRRRLSVSTAPRRWIGAARSCLLLRRRRLRGRICLRCRCSRCGRLAWPLSLALRRSMRLICTAGREAGSCGAACSTDPISCCTPGAPPIRTPSAASCRAGTCPHTVTWTSRAA